MFYSAKMNMREFLFNADEFNEFVPRVDRQGGSVRDFVSEDLGKGGKEVGIKGNDFYVRSSWVHFSNHTTIQNPAREAMAGRVSAGNRVYRTRGEGMGEMVWDWTPSIIEISRQITTKTADRQIYVLTEHRFVRMRQQLRDKTNTEVQCALLFSKAGLCAIKGVVKRSELLAVLNGVRAMNFVRKRMDIGNATGILCTDSISVLNWIQNKTRVQPLFVENILEEIRITTAQFRYVLN